MIEYRVRKDLDIDPTTGNTSHVYFPEYKRSLFGVGYWTRFRGFKGTARITGASTNPDMAWNYTNAKKQKETEYLYQNKYQ